MGMIWFHIAPNYRRLRRPNRSRSPKRQEKHVDEHGASIYVPEFPYSQISPVTIASDDLDVDRYYLAMSNAFRDTSVPRYIEFVLIGYRSAQAVR